MFFHLGGKHYNYIRKDSPADSWSDQSKLIWNRSFQYFFRLLSLIIFYFLCVPLIIDIPNAINNGYLEKTVIIEEISRQNLYPTAILFQPLNIETDEYLCFGFGFFEKGARYQLKYLPKSKFVLEANKINE